ncbi:GH92 family glycosyl hydrolase [Sunxiuqinia sp. sy24]|uniref:GH92 family glycosyl hydrolase n=1 Tax=Sunxiuqinia sp. sy24 TaxID=3461495 RepID=UPI004045AE59
MRIFILTVFLSIVLACNGKRKLEYVNPFIGASQTSHVSNWEGHGRTYPGSVAPFGYIQLTPETSVGSWKGYEYHTKSIYFFSCFGHPSGYPDGSSGRCFVMPVENMNFFELLKSSRPFLHDKEKAEPGYYKVKFEDNGTLVETTASTRTGMFRFTFGEGITPKIFIGDIGEFELVSNSAIKGSTRNVWFDFNMEWSRIEKQNDGVILVFDKPASGSVLLKVSSSSVSSQNAKENIDTEIPGWDFDATKNRTQDLWEQHLSRIEVDGGSTSDKIKFYTALYHSLLFPWIISDVNKEYKGRDQQIYRAKGSCQYDFFSPWDTFRSLHPLFCLIATQRQNDMIISMLDVYRQSGKLPTDPMTGYHAIPIIVDSYLKGIRGFDKKQAYWAMKESLMNAPFLYEDMPAYISNGYVPASFSESVTRTVEYAYNDWAMSQYIRKVMKNTDDYSYWLQRGLSYRNLFDPNQLFLVPRGKDGFLQSHGNFGFKEGDKWNYSFFVPHNPRDLINRMGGDEAFTDLLDSAILSKRILFDNEPNFHIPYLFNYSKNPAKTQKWIAHIRDEYFDSTERGLPGNDDLGSMSSWFVFNALGIYPVCPGVPEYNIGTPMFKKVVIHLDNEKEFVINGEEVSAENKYIQSATLNGEQFNQPYVSHALLTDGGELTFSMGKYPSDWAANSKQEAYSATKIKSQIELDSVSVSSETVDPDELFWLKFRLVNKGAEGVKIIRLNVEEREVASSNFFVDEKAIVVDSLSCRLYKPGLIEIRFKGSEEKVEITVNESELRKIEYSQLSFFPMIEPGEKQKISFYVKNAGGKSDEPELKIVQNGVLVKTDKISLKPGEKIKLKYELSDSKAGLNKLKVGSMTGNYKVYTDNLSAILVDLDFQKECDGKLSDKSGFSNDGIIKTNTPGVFLQNGFDDDAFVEIKQNSSFGSLKNKITLMAWIKASEENSVLSSVITQGDHNVIQVINNRQIEFFTGGWGRGICNAELPADYFGKWHHIAGMCDGKSLKLFVDGELKGTAEISREVPLNTHGNWNLGRNEEFPNKRIYYGEMKGVKIFASPLSQQEIRRLMCN